MRAVLGNGLCGDRATGFTADGLNVGPRCSSNVPCSCEMATECEAARCDADSFDMVLSR